jgi:hypothetical protein
MQSEYSIRQLLHYRFTPRMKNINTQSCSNFHSIYPTASKKHCLSKVHILFICGCGFTSLPVCINTGSTAFKCSDPLVHTSLWQTVVHTWHPVFNRSLPLSFLQSSKNVLLHVACPRCKPVVQLSSLHHTHSAQANYSWTTFSVCHHLTLRKSTTKLSSVANHKIKIFQYCSYLLNLLCTRVMHLSPVEMCA